MLLDSATEKDGALVVAERLTQQEIAKRIGASREVVSRSLTDLREGGYIAIENDRIAIQRPLPKRWSSSAYRFEFGDQRGGLARVTTVAPSFIFTSTSRGLRIW